MSMATDLRMKLSLSTVPITISDLQLPTLKLHENFEHSDGQLILIDLAVVPKVISKKIKLQHTFNA